MRLRGAGGAALLLADVLLAAAVLGGALLWFATERFRKAAAGD